MKKLRVIGLMALVIGIGIGTMSPKIVAAWDGMPRLRAFRFIHQLNLTDSQRAEGRKIIIAHKDELRSAVDAVFAERKALLELTQKQNFDEQAVRSAAKNISAAQENLIVKRTLVMNELKSILDETQLAKVNAAVEKFLRHRSERVAEHRDRVDSWLEHLQES